MSNETRKHSISISDTSFTPATVCVYISHDKASSTFALTSYFRTVSYSCTFPDYNHQSVQRFCSMLSCLSREQTTSRQGNMEKRNKAAHADQALYLWSGQSHIFRRFTLHPICISSQTADVFQQDVAKVKMHLCICNRNSCQEKLHH